MKRMKLAGYLLAVTILSVVVICQIFSGWIPVRLNKKILFPLHTDNTKNTLSWAVKLVKNSNSKNNISKIASDLGLINKGQIGHLDDIYLFHYIDNLMSNLSADLQRETVENDAKLMLYHQKIFSESELEDIIQQTEEKMNNHLDIVWHSHQKILSRSKRSLHFQDPFYNRQWHLVSFSSKFTIFTL